VVKKTAERLLEQPPVQYVNDFPSIQ
jgi:hypothetical protein